ncbi:hypothetical protein GCM10023311_23560 [Flaviramulus aquimarinus]|uniref:Right handed beta helix domain-containing protein n=1 Tax=Flaviramulus aquimarinus TaxID=1170456 RepID=A0ABP9FKC1_9FLAO
MKTVIKPMLLTFFLMISMISCNNEDTFIEPYGENDTEGVGSVEDDENNTEDSNNTDDRTEIFIDSGSSTTVQSAIDDLSGDGIITVTGWVTIDLNITIPSGILLRVNNGGGFNIKSGSTLTLQGPVNAGLYKIFDSTVNFVNGSVSEVKSEWFGTDDIAVNFALLSAVTIPVKITNNITVSSVILMSDNQTLRMYDATIFPVSPVTGGAVIKNREASNSNISIEGGYINGESLTDVAYDAILFENVDNALIKDLTCYKVHIRSSHDTGNITLNHCTYSTVQNFKSYDTWKAGIYIRYGHHNQILDSEMKGCHDSGIALVNSHDSIIDGNYVDNCGTSNASNIASGAERIIVTNNISVNSLGDVNGNGITMGHAGFPSTDATCSNNIIVNNTAKGIFLQAGNNMIVKNNIVINNGIDNNGTNSGGIANYSKSNLIEGNYVIGNRLGISLHNGSFNMVIKNNSILSSIIYGIRNDGVNTTVQNNSLGNTTNIFNNPEKNSIANLTFSNNNEMPPVFPVDYSFISDLNLTDFQNEILRKLLKF